PIDEHGRKCVNNNLTIPAPIHCELYDIFQVYPLLIINQNKT
ncbi:MAG: hypothetical protein ACI845_004063, partial [Gammaproteobacteria bacterium]